MFNYIGCFMATCLGFLIGSFKFISEKDAQIISILSWITALYILSIGG